MTSVYEALQEISSKTTNPQLKEYFRENPPRKDGNKLYLFDLFHLELSFSHDEFQSFCAALKTDTQYKEIYFYIEPVAEDFHFFTGALCENETLKILRFRNTLSEANQQLLVAAMKKNKTIELLGNNTFNSSSFIKSPLQKDIDKYTRRNRALNVVREMKMLSAEINLEDIRSNYANYSSAPLSLRAIISSLKDFTIDELSDIARQEIRECLEVFALCNDLQNFHGNVPLLNKKITFKTPEFQYLIQQHQARTVLNVLSGRTPLNSTSPLPPNTSKPSLVSTDTVKVTNNVDLNNPILLGEQFIKGMKPVEQVKPEEQDEQLRNEKATQIQTKVRAHQARKVYDKMKKKKEQEEQAKQEEQSSELFDKPSRFSDESMGNVDLSNPILLAEQVGEEASQIEKFFSSNKSKEIEEAGLDFIFSMGVIQRVLESLTELDNDELTIDEVREIEILTAQEKKEFFDSVVSPLNNSLSYLAQEEQNISRPIVNKAIQIFEKAYNETEEKLKNKLTEYKAKDSAKTQVEKATQIQAQVRGHQARNVYGEMKQKKEQEKKNTPVVSTPSDIPVYPGQSSELSNKLSRFSDESISNVDLNDPELLLAQFKNDVQQMEKLVSTLIMSSSYSSEGVGMILAMGDFISSGNVISELLELLIKLDNDQLTIKEVQFHFEKRAILTAQGKQKLFDNMALQLNKVLPYLTQEKQNIARPIINQAIQIFEKAYNATEEKLKNKLTEYKAKNSAKTQAEMAAAPIQAKVERHQAPNVYGEMTQEKERIKQEKERSKQEKERIKQEQERIKQEQEQAKQEQEQAKLEQEQFEQEQEQVEQGQEQVEQLKNEKATQIQAQVRGHQARNVYGEMKKEQEQGKKNTPVVSTPSDIPVYPGQSSELSNKLSRFRNKSIDNVALISPMLLAEQLREDTNQIEQLFSHDESKEIEKAKDAFISNMAIIQQVLKSLTKLDNDELPIEEVRQIETFTAQEKKEFFDSMLLALNGSLSYLTQKEQNVARPIVNKAIQILKNAHNEIEEKVKNKLTEYNENDSANTVTATNNVDLNDPELLLAQFTNDVVQMEELFSTSIRSSYNSIEDIRMASTMASTMGKFISSAKVIGMLLELLIKLDNGTLPIDEAQSHFKQRAILTAQGKQELFDDMASKLNEVLRSFPQEKQNIARPIINKAIQIFEKAYNKTEEKLKNKVTEYEAKNSDETAVERAAAPIQEQVEGYQAPNVYGKMKKEQEQGKKNTPVVSTPSDIPVYLEQFNELCQQLLDLRKESNAHLTPKQTEALDSLLEVIQQNFDAFSKDKTRTNFETFLTRSTERIENAKNAFSTVKTDSKKTVWVQFLDLLNAMYTTVLNLFTCMKSESKPGLFQSETTNQVLNKIDLDSIASQLQGIGSAMEKDIVKDKEMKL